MRKLRPGFRLGDRNPRVCAKGDLRVGDLHIDDLHIDVRHGEQGFMLVGLIVAIFIILLVLGIAAPKMAQELRREKEVEAVHRGNQYVRAIQLYYRKNNSYPGTMDALAKGTPVKYLRQEYVDPFTGKADWRLIHVGEAKTTVKGFFGKPLTGLAPGLGSAAGLASPGAAGAGAAGSSSAFGSSSGSAFGSSGAGSGSSAFGGSSGTTLGGTSSAGATSGGTTGAGSSSPGASGATGSTDSSGVASTGTGTNSTLGSAAGIASQSTGGFSGGGAPFVGVGIPKEGTSIKVLNEQTSYNTWEFIYDPRIEQMKGAAGLQGGGTQGLGSAGGLSSGVGGTGTGTGTSGFGSSGSSGFGSSPSSGFGSSPSSGFGSSPSSGFGSSPTSGSQGSGTTTPTTPQQPQ
ncbi:type II secretion system protein [Tunturiibacter gelidoferens]|uniref:Type II secretory pathway pseudopilin PulG n=1 Tax=Tunturiibacter gelidiferens TaxID=3069689 RepID=A0ACC5NT92_9BACT|nr:type II secretion system protein [Edaphobacter lichenicola]MBB5337778.1 type II secretory pathway pseudopilin PulG [Edaphobacter lichenicola]